MSEASTLAPADEFYLALCDEEPRRLVAAGANVGFVRELYPQMSMEVSDQARVVIAHARTWLSESMFLMPDGRHMQLQSKIRRYLRVQNKAITTAVSSRGGMMSARPLNSKMQARIETNLLMAHRFQDPTDASLLATCYTAMVFIGPMYENGSFGNVVLDVIRPIGEQIWRDTARH